MKIEAVQAEMKAKKLAGVCFEKEGRGKFRDLVTVGVNGRFLFERYCYGEAASKTCTMVANGMDAEENILWKYEECQYSGKTEAPVKLTNVAEGNLYFDDARWAWQPKEELKAVPELGLGKLKMLFNKG